MRHFAYCNGWYSAGVAQAPCGGIRQRGDYGDMPNMPGVDPYALKRKLLWEMFSTGLFGGWSKALAACQFNDVFGMLALTKPVLGAHPTRFGSGRPEDLVQTAHG